MTVTATIVLLAAIGLGLRITVGLHRALIGRRSGLSRLVVGVAGLGYGLADPLRGTLIGLALAGVGAAAMGALLRDLMGILRRLPQPLHALGTSTALGADAPAAVGRYAATTRARGSEPAESLTACPHAPARRRLSPHHRRLG